MTTDALYPTWVGRQLCEATGLEPSLVRELSRLAKHVVDELVADDYAVMAPPFLAFRVGDPVVERATELLKDPSWEPPEELWTSSADEVALALGLERAVVERFPVAAEIHIILGMIDHAGYDAEDPEAETIQQFVYAWLDTWDYRSGRGRTRRRYGTSQVGDIDQLRGWFSANSRWIGNKSFALGELERSIEDDALLYRGLDAASSTVHVMLNPGMVDERLLERAVKRHQSLCAARADAVQGWLVADGLTIAAEDVLSESELGYLSLTEIGYRRHLFDEGNLDVSDDPGSDPVRLASWCVIG